jgi:glutaminyl-tRNA synthetase
MTRKAAEVIPQTGAKVKGTIQWVDASTAQPCEVRLYDRLFNKPDPEKVEEGGDFTDNLNPDSLEIIPMPWLNHR